MRTHASFSTAIAVKAIKRRWRAPAVVTLHLEDGRDVELAAGDTLVLSCETNYDGSPESSGNSHISGRVAEQQARPPDTGRREMRG